MSEEIEDQLTEAVRLINSELYKEAIILLRDLVEKHPDSLEGWYNLGIALTEAGKLDEAEEAYDEALAIDNQVFEIWFNKGNVLYELGDFKKAKECYEKALELDTDDAEAWNNLGNTYSRLTEGQKAIEAYTKAVALRPNYAEALYNKANAHFIEHENEHAIAYAEMALEIDPSLSSHINQWLAVAKDRLKAEQDHEEYEQEKKDSNLLNNPDNSINESD